MRQFAVRTNSVNSAIRQSWNFFYNLPMSEKKKVRLTETVKAAG
jgi:hypothetical protein